jgi:hypothetical protein
MMKFPNSLSGQVNNVNTNGVDGSYSAIANRLGDPRNVAAPPHSFGDARSFVANHVDLNHNANLDTNALSSLAPNVNGISDALNQPLVNSALNNGMFNNINGGRLSMHDDSFSTIVKRVFAESSLLVMFANTISSVLAISTDLALLAFEDSLCFAADYICEYGVAPQKYYLYVQCNYAADPGFISILSLWCIYFVVHFWWRYYWASTYQTNDLRYYVYCDKFNHTLMNQVMIVFGGLLTIISGGYAIAMVVGNGKVESIPSIFFFVAFNMFNLRQMSRCRFTALYHIEMSRTEVFRQPIIISTVPLWNIWNLNGLLVTHYAIFEHITDAVGAFFLTGDRSHVDRIGQFEQLKAVTKTLNSLKL